MRLLIKRTTRKVQWTILKLKNLKSANIRPAHNVARLSRKLDANGRTSHRSSIKLYSLVSNSINM